MEARSELFLVVLLLVFLGIRAYYGMKLLNLIYVVFPYSMIEKRYLGIFSVMIMRVVMIIFVNLYLSLMVRLRLEIMSFKMMIYLFVGIFLILSLITNLNLKFNIYEKTKNFIEVWLVNVYELDKFIYWNINVVIGVVERVGRVKIILLINWWVIAFVLVLL